MKKRAAWIYTRQGEQAIKVRLVVRISPETDRDLYRAAGKAGLTKSEFVEQAIRPNIASAR